MKYLLLALLGALQIQARQPNIVFILADDLGVGDLGCYGQTKIKTPNLDRMAAEGMLLTRHYSGNAVCAPSRCVLMSGLHPGHAFIRENRGSGDNAKTKIEGGRPDHEGQYPIPSETVTLVELFAAGGYITGGFGKWGLGGPGSTGEPLKQGFQRWFGYNCQSVAHNFYPTYLWDNDKVLNLKNPTFPAHDVFKSGEDPTKPESYKRFQGCDYSADLIAEQALKFARVNKDKPFFLYWPTTVPHLALQVPDDSLNEYQGQWADPPYMGGKGYLPHFAPRAAYAGMVTRMDREIGSLMALIQELGLDEDTIFIFTSDNGSLNGTHAGLAGTDAAFFNSAMSLRDGKGSLYEGGIRAPGIVRWKGQIKANVTSDRITGFEDWLPTLLDLAGAKNRIPNGLDGISFAPTLRGGEQAARSFLYREFPSYGGQQAIWLGRWKGIRQGLLPKQGKKKTAAISAALQLYDLAADPNESQDLSASHADIIAEMTGLLKSQHTPSRDFPFSALDH